MKCVWPAARKAAPSVCNISDVIYGGGCRLLWRVSLRKKEGALKDDDTSWEKEEKGEKPLKRKLMVKAAASRLRQKSGGVVCTPASSAAYVCG